LLVNDIIASNKPILNNR